MEICKQNERKIWERNFGFALFLKEHAFESSQKYKEGKYILELVHMIKDNGWDDENIDSKK